MFGVCGGTRFGSAAPPPRKGEDPFSRLPREGGVTGTHGTPPSCHSPLAGESKASSLSVGGPAGTSAEGGEVLGVVEWGSSCGGEFRCLGSGAVPLGGPPTEKSRGRLFSTPPRGGSDGRGALPALYRCSLWRPYSVGIGRGGQDMQCRHPSCAMSQEKSVRLAAPVRRGCRGFRARTLFLGGG